MKESTYRLTSSSCSSSAVLLTEAMDSMSTVAVSLLATRDVVSENLISCTHDGSLSMLTSAQEGETFDRSQYGNLSRWKNSHNLSYVTGFHSASACCRRRTVPIPYEGKSVSALGSYSTSPGAIMSSSLMLSKAYNCCDPRTTFDFFSRSLRGYNFSAR